MPVVGSSGLHNLCLPRFQHHCPLSLAFVLVCHHRHSTIFLNPLLQAGLQWLTQVPLVDIVHFNGFLLTYLFTRPIISLSHRAISAGIITKGKSFYKCEVLTLRHILACSLMVSCGTLVAPICCVIPPASPSWTFVLRNCQQQISHTIQLPNSNFVTSK